MNKLASGRGLVPSRTEKFGGVRLLLDENLPPVIALALRELNPKSFQFINGEPDPEDPSVSKDRRAIAPKGTKDAVVIEIARQQRLTLLTADVELALQCARTNVPVVFFAPAEQLTKWEYFYAVLTQSPGWRDALQKFDRCVIFAHRTRWSALDPDTGADKIARRKDRRDKTAAKAAQARSKRSHRSTADSQDTPAG